MENKDKGIYKYFSNYIFENIGIVYEEKDYYRLESRLLQMCRRFDVENIQALYSMYLQKITGEMHQTVLDIATNNETYFFRDTKPFVALSEDLLPRILKDRPGSGPINIWCGGCSSGQEPYSILMALSERLSASEIERINITATDISSEILTKAKSGTYTNLEIQRGLPITHLVKYFSDNSNESWTVKKEIRDRISFSEFNLLTGTFPRGKYDIIFCRNVIIYQNRENKNKILSSLFESLTPDGNLFLGSGESLIGTDISYLQENLQGSMTFKKKHKQAA